MIGIMNKKPMHIHFVGIKGVGMTPLAIIAKQAGFSVSGCDVADEYITDKLLKENTIMPIVGFSKEHLANVDFLITTGAHGGFDNPEVKIARNMQIPVITQGQAVGLFMQGEMFGRSQKGISVTGCHGKTTTTAMIATIFKSAGWDPSYIIGTGDIPSLGESGHFGKGEYFIAEADEYATEPVHDKTPKFLWQKPYILVITNIEFDHPDLYPSLDALTNSYEKFTNNIVQGGVFIANKDDKETQKILKRFSGNVITFGKSKQSDYQLLSWSYSQGRSTFTYKFKNKRYNVSLPVPGEHNCMNALAAIAASEYAGISFEEIKQGLKKFLGTKRRFEFKKTLESGTLVYDDYAHHPTEIYKTLEAAKSLFPEKNIICIFQPHTYSRTKMLFEQFKYSFKFADKVILAEIYPSARESADPSVSSEKLAQAVKETGKEVIYAATLPDVVKYLKAVPLTANDVLITMGAGDVYKIEEQLH